MSRTNFQKWTACLIGPIQDLETALQDLRLKRTVDLATGATLTMVGKLVGADPRTEPNDEVFRREVRAQIAVNKSDGLTEDLINIADLIVYVDDATYVVTNHGKGATTLKVEGVATAPEVATLLISYLRKAVGGGVRITVEVWPDVETEMFTWGDAGGDPIVGKGWGEASDPTVGGVWASALE